jgi:hypothetical protein
MTGYVVIPDPNDDGYELVHGDVDNVELPPEAEYFDTADEVEDHLSQLTPAGVGPQAPR